MFIVVWWWKQQGIVWRKKFNSKYTYFVLTMGALTGICVVFGRRALLYYNYIVDGPLIFTLAIQLNSGKRCRVRFFCSIDGDSPCDVLGNAWNNIALVVHDTLMLILRYFIPVSTCVHLWCLTTIHMIKSDYRWKYLHYLHITPHECMCQLIQRNVRVYKNNFSNYSVPCFPRVPLAQDFLHTFSAVFRSIYHPVSAAHL